MIVSKHEGWSLHCTGCGAFLELTAGEAKDPLRAVTRKRSMALLHQACSSYETQAVARDALKAQRAVAREGQVQGRGKREEGRENLG
jgi:hypothetical protein